jgi:hypothetical protein
VRHIPKTQERSTLSLPIPVTRGVFTLALAIMGLMLLTPRTASAQASAGITGTVTDTSGAVIRGANVTITNEGTSVADHTVTESAGTYSFKGVLPGKYTISVDATGFKKSVQKGVNVEVSSTATIDITLSAGAASETVQVAADQIALNTTQPELGSTIEPLVVDALPTEVSGRGRQVDQLQFLAPGTTGSTFSHRISGGVDFEEELMYNGIPAPQPETEGYSTNFNPPFDLVEESKVERSTFSAQYGLGQGALTYQMKSGTNQYHGSAFEINRNSFFDSVPFFDGPAWGGSTKPPTDHENNYGFSIGGPIRIPHLYDGRNKTFGNYSQEWFKQAVANDAISTVPTALEKTGNFTDFVNGSTGDLIPIFDPTTGQQFQCNGQLNVICPNRISANSALLIPFIPSPDRPGSGIGGLTSNKSAAANSFPNIQHVWGFVVDQTLTPTQSIHYAEWRNSYSTTDFDQNPFVLAPNPLNSMKYEPALGSIFLLNYSNAITPHLVMTAGFGWIGELNNQFNDTTGCGTTAGCSAVYPQIQNETVPAEVAWSGNNAPTQWGTDGSWLESINRKLGIAIVNNWLWSKGRNTFNIGGEYRRSYQDDNEEQTFGGQFTFSGHETSQVGPNFANYGSPFASFLLGLPDEANRSDSQELRLRNLAISPYVQDDIKLSSRLTLNLGVRWDIQVPFTENNNLIVYLDPDTPGTDPAAGGIPGGLTKFGTCTGCSGYDRASTHFTHIGPRFGFAYKLSNKMVVQGGFDVAFLNGGAYEYGTNKVAVNYANLLTGSFLRNASGSNASAFGDWDTNSIPAPAAVPFGPGIGDGLDIDAFSQKDGYAPYSQQWNMNVQRELPWNVFVEAAWVGNKVIHLPSQNNRINQQNPATFSPYANVLSTCAANAGNSVLTDTFATVAQGGNGCATVDGFTAPYANFVSDFGASSTVFQTMSEYPQFAYIFNNFEGFGETYYQSAQIEFDKRFSNGLSFLAGYTLSHLIDNTSSGFTTFTSGGLNKYNQKPEMVVSNSDEPQTLKVSGTYELPIGPGKRFVNNHLLGNVVGGWQVGWILDYENGGDFGPYEGSEISFPNEGNESDRPNRNTNVPLSTASYKVEKNYWLSGGTGTPPAVFNTAGFTNTPNQFILGNSIRAYGKLRDPGIANESLNARKHFYIGDHVQGILQLDYFNAFNRTIFNGPDTNSNDPTFAETNSEGANVGAFNGTSNRQGQIQFRLQF